ncbi:MAG: hypothetical protein HKP61_16020, partial [Dactylosporangium sp.]|nr:hypothetical protein [Dactylosporangium sp.]NNJ62412.1 hypothetical protein [Dactylosporangium sp.]
MGTAAGRVGEVVPVEGTAGACFRAAVGRRPGQEGAVPAEPGRGAAENDTAAGAGGRRGAVCAAGVSENDTAAGGRLAVTGVWVAVWENVTGPAGAAGVDSAGSVAEVWEEN